MQPMFIFMSMRLESWARACVPQRANPKVKAAGRRPIPIIVVIPPGRVICHARRRCTERSELCQSAKLSLAELSQSFLRDQAPDRNCRGCGRRWCVANVQHPSGFLEEKVM